MSLDEHENIHQFREYVSDTFYRMHCNVAGIMPLKWSDIRPEVKKEFRQRADQELDDWLTQQGPKKNWAEQGVEALEAHLIQFSTGPIRTTMEQIREQLAREIARKKDGVVHAEIERLTGLQMTPQEISPRLRVEIHPATRVEVWFFDSEPIVEFCPIKMSTLQDNETFSRNVSVNFEYRLFRR